MKIIPGSVNQRMPRRFHQLGTIIIESGDVMVQINWEEVKAYRGHEVRAKRICQKNGKPLGPWLYIVQNRSYQIPMERS